MPEAIEATTSSTTPPLSSNTVGNKVFVRDDERVWVEAEIVEDGGGNTVTVRLLETSSQQQQQRTVCLDDYADDQLPAQNDHVDAPQPDMTDLTHLHEPGVLWNLRQRYANDQPYTRCGDMIVSINPFRWLKELYDGRSRNLYANTMVWQNTMGDARTQVDPHIFEVSYWFAKCNRKIQCLLTVIP